MGMFDFLNANPLSGANSDGFSGLAANPLFAMGMQMLQNSAKQVGGSRPLFEGMLPAMSGAARNSALMQSMKASAQQQEYQKWQMDKAKQDAIAHDSAMSQINAALGAGNDYTRDAGVTNLAMQSEPASTRAMGAPMPPNPLSTDSLIPIMMQDPQMQNSGLQLLMAKAQQQRSQDFLNSLPGGQGAAPGPLSGSTFDPKVYAALKASGDPAQSAYAEVYKEQNLMPAPAAASQAWKQFTYANPSATERANLGIQGARLGLDQQAAAREAARLFFETGLGAPPAGVAGVTPPAGPAAPQDTPVAPQAAPVAPNAPRPMSPRAQEQVAVDAAKQAAETQAKRMQELPKAKASMGDAVASLQELDTSLAELSGDPYIDKASGKVAYPGTPGLNRITGPVAGRTPNLTTTATNAQATLDNIKSKVVLNTMQKLKELSQTGATGFGATSKNEIEILQNSIAALDQAQGTPHFAQELGKVRQNVAKTMQRLQNTYNEVYAPLEGGSAPGVKFLGFE